MATHSVPRREDAPTHNMDNNMFAPFTELEMQELCGEAEEEEDLPTQPEVGNGREVHVTATMAQISQFVDSDQSSQICFRCGNTGHVRYQCLSYKVRLCWHYQHGTCHDRRCTFAHGIEELRTPWKARCVRVIKHGQRLITIGCNSPDHTFRRCPHNSNMLML